MDQFDDPAGIPVQFMKDKEWDLGVLHQGSDIGIDETPDLIRKFSFRGEYFHQVGDHTGESFDKDRFEEPVFTSEIVMKQRLVDAGFVCDHLHGGPVESIFQEDFPGGIEDQDFRFCMFDIHVYQKV